jgi:hypothetical protein
MENFFRIKNGNFMKFVDMKGKDLELATAEFATSVA